MRRTIFALVLLYSLFATQLQLAALPRNIPQDAMFDFTIVGAGPAGIITVALLLDLGIDPLRIAWIDEQFNVGRLGQYYANVPSNTKTRLFVQFMHSCKTLEACVSPAFERLHSYDQEKEYPLHIIVEPLQDITDYLRTRVPSLKARLLSLYYEDNTWKVGTPEHKIKSKNVVLATGSHPRSLNYPCEQEIPLDLALDADLLKAAVNTSDAVAVIGGSHSAILILKTLSESSVKYIFNFYKHPIQYAVDMGDWILHNSDGLKGTTAAWAREVLEKEPPANLVRILNRPAALDVWLPLCNKIIYAVGYERNCLPTINGEENPEGAYDDTTGIIAPNLFGIGIAFPDRHMDPQGNVEHRVGLNSFMEYAQRVVPQWANKSESRTRLLSFEQLFAIDLL